MEDELDVDKLIRTWKFQDEFEEISLSLLKSGIELGARSAILSIAKTYINKNYETLETEDFQKAQNESIVRASEEIERRVKSVRRPNSTEE